MRRLVGGKLLRCGYTTGVCAAAAAKAAAAMLADGRLLDTVAIETPAGLPLDLDVVDAKLGDGHASCAVRKDGGDDPDATDGALIYADVSRAGPGVVIDGGEGVGRVTKPGLDQPVGAAAINSVPRRLIEQAVRSAGPDDGHGWRVVISCPEGGQIAAKTFNPRLGITDGISILGTTGIVEPMSNSAIIETTAREISVLAAAGAKDLLVVIGNYGEAFARDQLGLDFGGASGLAGPGRPGAVMSSNFIGDAIAQAAANGFERVLVVGHLGKLAKAGIGMLNTHSSVGDGRLETLIACALQAGADLATLRRLQESVSTDAAVFVLSQAGWLTDSMRVLSCRIQAAFDRHSPASLELEWICFAKLNGAFSVVARSPRSQDLVRRWLHA
jgi:cobalt-precorrin-5B (C1)-methyltransferase